MVFATPLFAVEPDEVLDDPVLEARARAISEDVRCVVCQNEPIDSSNAGVARDLRMIIRERLLAGDTDQEVFDFLVLRYGDYVLFNPPWKPSTYALWLGPFVILFVGFVAVVIALTRRRTAQPASLTKAEQEKLDAMRGGDAP
ncbi:cytochrome c-type biogenesis protein [uncultured Litoreibacter sp.]|nr:cytochrome c-type biogenesis protein [uncultured Litoreibacter sp.]